MVDIGLDDNHPLNVNGGIDSGALSRRQGNAVRKSKQEAARTRARILETAAREFRRKGISGTGLSDLMAAAGLSHGGFYRHFASKDQLVAESCAAGFDAWDKVIAALLSPGGEGKGPEAFAESYLSEGHRDDPSAGCLLAALGSELARADEKTRAVVTEGLAKLADHIASQCRGMRRDVARRRALLALSTLVGALTLARMVTDPKLSRALLLEAAKHVPTLLSKS